MATTISGPSVTDDTGTPASPNNDGTLIDSAFFTSFYSAINAMWSGATQVFDGIFSVTGAGVHTFSAGVNGDNKIRIKNTTNGAAALAGVQMGNDASDNVGSLYGFASSYSGAADSAAGGVRLQSALAGGLDVSAIHASGTLRLYGGGTTVSATVDGNGVQFDQAPDLTVAAPGSPDTSRLYVDSIVTAWAFVEYSAGTPAVTDHVNLGGTVTDNGTGDTTLTFDTALANANYAVAMTLLTTSASTAETKIHTKTTTTIRCLCELGGSPFDADFMIIVVGGN